MARSGPVFEVRMARACRWRRACPGVSRQRATLSGGRPFQQASHRRSLFPTKSASPGPTAKSVSCSATGDLMGSSCGRVPSRHRARIRETHATVRHLRRQPATVATFTPSSLNTASSPTTRKGRGAGMCPWDLFPCCTAWRRRSLSQEGTWCSWPIRPRTLSSRPMTKKAVLEGGMCRDSTDQWAGNVPAAVEFGRVATTPVNTLRQRTHRCQEISDRFEAREQERPYGDSL